MTINPIILCHKGDRTAAPSSFYNRTSLIFIIRLTSIASLILVSVGFYFSNPVANYQYAANDANSNSNFPFRGLEASHRPPVDMNNHHRDRPLVTSTDYPTLESSIAKEEPKLSSIQNSTYNLNQKYLTYLRNRLPPFPKKLHILFPHKEYYRAVDPPLPFVQHSILRFMERNPNWNVTVHDDRDVDALIARAARDEIISMEERDILVGNGSDSFPGAHPVERGDLARMLLMWYEGGMYVDVDSLINRSFDEVFTANVKMCISIYDTDNFSQSIVCSSPNNKLFLQIIRAMSKKRMTGGPNGGPLERRGGWAKGGDLFSMGPPIYNRFVLRRFFGKIDYVRGYVPHILEAKKALLEGATDTIAVGQWKSRCESFLVEPFEGCWYLNRTELYAMYNISRWGTAVQERWNDPAFNPKRKRFGW